MRNRIKGLWQLIRIIPVLSWSGAGVLTTLLPLVLYHNAPLWLVFPFIGGVLVQGLLAHSINDLTDYNSKTDQYSPGILSGGSRVIQKGLLTIPQLKALILLLLFLGIFSEFLFIENDQYVLSIVMAIGIWSALSYSLPPLRLSYAPFIGEWLCAFPAMISLSLTSPLFYLHNLPDWAIENAIVHAFLSLGWLMIHHIPDCDADKTALPCKNTTVVWSLHHFRNKKWAAKLPAFFYITLAGLFVLSFFVQRPLATAGSFFIILSILYLVFHTDPDSLEKVTLTEMKVIVLTFCNAIWLGIFI